MKPLTHIAILLGLWLGSIAPLRAEVFDQSALLYISTNSFQRGVNWQSQGGLPRPGVGDSAPTASQFQGGIVYGAVTYQQTVADLIPGKSLPENADTLNWPRSKDGNTVQLVLRAQAGAPYLSLAVSYYFGSIIPVPETDTNGFALPAGTAGSTYWFSEPWTTNHHGGDLEPAGPPYYWSPHAGAVFAVQPGLIQITWRKRVTLGPNPPGDYAGNENKKYALVGGNYYRLRTVDYIISGGAIKTPQPLYWTESIYSSIGKRIQVPNDRIKEIHFVYNSEVPKQVPPNELVQPYTGPLTPQSTNTVWFDNGAISAYNKEGRIFVELLGEAVQGDVRRHLGYEIVDIIREAIPADVTAEIGDRLTPFAVNSVGDGDFQPEPVDLASPFSYRHNVGSDGRVNLYATRETRNVNDFQAYWMRPGVEGLLWPARFVRYKLGWPGDTSKYSHYLRPAASDDATAKQTAVVVSAANVPVIEYEDPDPTGKVRSKITAEFKFYTILDAGFPSLRTLLRYNVGENVAFERVLSTLDTSIRSAPFQPDGLNVVALNLTGAVDSSGSLPAGNYFNGVNGSSNFTVEAWVYLRRHQNGQRLFDFGNGSPLDNVYLALSSASGGPVFSIANNITLSAIAAPTALALSNWIHLAVVFDATNSVGTIYTNGIAAKTGPLTIPRNVVRTNNFIGASNWPADPKTDAMIDNFRIWTVARTQQQIADSKDNSVVPGTSGLLAQYLFNADNGAGSRFAGDSSGHGLSMALQFGALLPDVSTRPRVVQAGAYVGQRITAPSGESVSGAGFPYLAGYIRPSEGTSFSVTAYKDPFVAGFEQAAAGAIIPVNATNDNATLEVWWFRQNGNDAAKGFTPIYWPSVVGRYRVTWPTTAPYSREIILASNDGSGGLTSLEAKGSIYFQNDPAQPGYNPNEEHALMQGGQAYALRDDLNLATSSPPYVLLEYTDSDGRPNMTVFQVVREQGDIKFDYQVTAGTILQPPMPLPLMEKPLGPRFIGAPPKSLNEEVGSFVVESSTATPPDTSLSHVTVTTSTRHLFSFSERPSLALQTVSSSGVAATRWFYVTNSNPDHNRLDGVVSDRAPIPLAAWDRDSQSTEPDRHRFEVASLDGLETNRYAALRNTTMPFNWLVTVRATNSVTIAGTIHRFVEVESPGLSLLDEMKNAQLLAFPLLTNVAVDAFQNWHLGFEKIPASIKDGALQEFYTHFTKQDRKGNVWVYRGPHDLADEPQMLVQFYYKTLPGFYFPTAAAQPPVGTITPYLRLRNLDGTFGGDGIFGNADNDSQGDRNALGIKYRPVWPESAPVLHMAETLTLAKRGLPQVRGQLSLEILYQQSQVTGGVARTSAVLHDPTREKTFTLGPRDGAALDKIPDSVKTADYRGKTYFPNLPPHLVERFFFDRNRGTNGALVFKGQFFDEPVGDRFVLLNVLGNQDIQFLRDLCLSDPADQKRKWDAAITNGLQTKMELFIENPAKPGTYFPSQPATIGPQQLAEVVDDDVAVDSYALTATGPGTNYVTLIAGNGLAFTPVDEPVSVYIIKVVDTLYRGELKIVQSSNPLAETVTFQQVVDLAGKVQDYEFEWKIASPVDGKPPGVYQNTPATLLRDGAWTHIREPLTGDSPATIPVIPAARRVADVVGSVIPVSAFPFSSVSPVDGKLQFVLSTSQTFTIAPGNKVAVRTRSGRDLNGTVITASPGSNNATNLVVQMEGDLPAVSDVLQLSERQVPDQPQSLVFRDFNLATVNTYSQYYLSLDLDSALGAEVYVDGTLAVTANRGASDSAPVTPPSGFSSLSRVYRLGPEVFAGGAAQIGSVTHRLVVRLFSAALPGTNQVFNLRLEAYQAVDLASVAGSQWLPLDQDKYRDKVRAILGGTADVRSLADNYLIAHYRATNTAHASFRANLGDVKQGWSQWTEPQLAEGWIKRVLAGINPFNQRVSDLFNNRVNTDVSILTQAGQRWEGDVALNLDNINNSGLIEIYETVLRRGKMLSIGAGINFGPANDALLLAAGYLSDLYMMLGNEAWADASNPTIGIGTKDKTYGDIATALFAFKGQVPSLLEEELALLRGRDDFLQPGVETRPVYNRLFWNYTRGIDSGEVIYALNYNIQENNAEGVDGVINADDARKMFPQGHGDAYGHYLTALKGYYSLLMDNDFDWVPRTEAVTVLGKPVQVDYQDERKFATAAAAVARAGRQIFDLVWRKDYQPGDDVGWQHFGTNRVNSSPPNATRYWSLDHWACRTMQGAYLNWALGNSILPAVDPDPSHEGIEKVDRTTVPELKELAGTVDDLQTALENAEGRLVPLSLPNGGMVFDINPTRVTGANAETHFEQIYGRAKGALINAVAAFDDAKDVTRLMRSEQDSLAELQSQMAQQELVYTNSLIEIYGTPYPDDVGPGKTYKQGYAGPDLIHYPYVDIVELTFGESINPATPTTFKLDIQLFVDDFKSKLYTDFDWLHRADEDGSSTYLATDYIEYVLDPHEFFGKPSTWQGKRPSPGKLQQAIAGIVQARNQAASALVDADWGKTTLDKAIQNLNARIKTHGEIRDIQRGLLIADRSLKAGQIALEIFDKAMDATEELIKGTKVALKDALPGSFIAGFANGGDLTSGLKASIETAKSLTKFKTDWAAFLSFSIQKTLEFTTETTRDSTEFDQIQPKEFDQELRDAVVEINEKLAALQSFGFPVNSRLQELDNARRNYTALEAQGLRIQDEREQFRRRSAALVQGFRTRDAAFRIFRNEKLERYKTLFDLAARYSFLAANAFDYETGLLNTPQGKAFVNRIVNARALGVMRNGEPQYAGSNTGDPGLSSVLAEMKADWDVLKGRLGFNNPDAYGTTVSLRRENARIIAAADGDSSWKDVLQLGRKANLLDDPDVRRYCLQIDRGNGLPVPGIVVDFSTTIADGLNLFGQSLAGGDHYFDPSSFATKIFAVGVAFEGYIGMDNPVANTAAVNAAGGYTPPDPSTTFLGSKSLAATPGIYLIPVGVDSMRSPPLGDASVIRSWSVNDVAIPLPFNIGGSDFSTKQLWQSSASLTEPMFAVRKHQAFRPVSNAAVFTGNIYSSNGQLQMSQFTNTRLIGRSAWNSRWKLVIAGHKLLNNPEEGLDRFIDTIKDIKLHFVTYSYSGN